MLRYRLVTALSLLAFGAAPALGQAQAKFDRTAAEAKLKSLFPAGKRDGREGVMKLGNNFRTVSIKTWEHCLDLCQKSPSDGTLGCAVWTFIKPADAKMPSICRMWPTPPELKDSPTAVSGAGKFK